MALKMVYFKVKTKSEVWWEHNSRLQGVQESQVKFDEALIVRLSDFQNSQKLGEVGLGDF